MMNVGIVVGSDERNQLSLHPEFAEATLSVGGSPILLPKNYGGRRTQLERILRSLDALILVGGGDISCEYYKQKRRATLQDVDHVRDEVEIYAARWAVTNNLRVLGVCRGAQILAVATGGTLHQDLPAEGYDKHICDRVGAIEATLRHRITLQADTLVKQVFGDVEEVNSHHHQAISHPGSFLKATGWSDDGVIEAVEAENILGVQWHPELLLTNSQRPLSPFRWLLDSRDEVSTSASQCLQRSLS